MTQFHTPANNSARGHWLSSFGLGDLDGGSHLRRTAGAEEDCIDPNSRRKKKELWTKTESMEKEGRG